MEGIWPAITVIGYLLLFILKGWAAGEPERKQEDRNEDTQRGRKDIADGNVAAVGARIDVLCQDSSNTAKLGTDEDTSRRLAEITGG